MASERKLTVVLAGDAKGLNSTLATTSGKVDGFGQKVGGLSGKAKLAMAGAATAVVAFSKSSVDAYVEAETAQANLTAAFEKFPQLAGSNTDALRDLNSELAKKTQFDDDATASAQAVLAGFGLTEKQLRDVTPLLQDYAAKTGKDLPSAATDLGKAVLGQGRALKGVGLEFKDTGDAGKNFDQLMGGLSDKVGGFAEVAGDTAAGKAAILKNQFGELQESVGSALVPALTKLADIIVGDVLPVIEKVGGWLADHKPVLIAVAGVIGVGLVAAFVSWAAAAASAAAATIAATWPILAIAAAVAALVAGVIYAYNHWGFFKTAVDAVASFITGTLWPALQSIASFFTDVLVPAIATAIGWIRDHWQIVLTLITGPIGAAVAIVITHWDKIKNAIMTVFNWIRDNWKLVLGFLTGPIGAAVYVISRHWETIKGGVDAVVSFFAGLPGRIGSAVSTLASTIKRPFTTAFDAIKRLWNNTVGGFGFSVPSWVPGVGGKSFEIPEMASGGIVTKPTIALIGEAGPEAVVPLGGRTAMLAGAAGGGGISVHLDLRGAVGITGPAVEKWVRDAVEGAVRRDGRIPGTNIVKATP